MVLGNPRIASAIGTQALTKRQMYVDTDPLISGKPEGISDSPLPFLRLKFFVFPKRNGGITRITRCRHVILGY
jgi:hypothetical protein